ncbi:ubiquitin-conjugating enzyme/RWD-like protein [Lipomyces japonicus]|uniref:ubiquitin-conjugating enzyme/RWD-like protein n=1 Tax=Lipomyces japonicus TaxID=56871 RepID=UPI0034CE8124
MSLSTTASRRLLKEYKELLTGSTSATSKTAIQLGPVVDDDMFHWAGTVLGPDSTPYEGGSFKVDIEVPVNYPLAPPRLRFTTRTCHPNVSFQTGEICLDVLDTQWTAAWTIHATCLAVQALLSSPEPASPLNIDAANVLRHDPVAYDGLVRYYVHKYAM